MFSLRGVGLVFVRYRKQLPIFFSTSTTEIPHGGANKKVLAEKTFQGSYNKYKCLFKTNI